jgi:beta-galactosidase GanA
MVHYGGLSFNLLTTDADVTTASIQQIETKEETVGMSVTGWHFSVLTSYLQYMGECGFEYNETAAERKIQTTIRSLKSSLEQTLL